jgi:hypothetical protein
LSVNANNGRGAESVDSAHPTLRQKAKMREENIIQTMA